MQPGSNLQSHSLELSFSPSAATIKLLYFHFYRLWGMKKEMYILYDERVIRLFVDIAFFFDFVSGFFHSLFQLFSRLLSSSSFSFFPTSSRSSVYYLKGLFSKADLCRN